MLPHCTQVVLSRLCCMQGIAKDASTCEPHWWCPQSHLYLPLTAAVCRRQRVPPPALISTVAPQAACQRRSRTACPQSQVPWLAARKPLERLYHSACIWNLQMSRAGTRVSGLCPAHAPSSSPGCPVPAPQGPYSSVQACSPAPSEGWCAVLSVVTCASASQQCTAACCLALQNSFQQRAIICESRTF